MPGQASSPGFHLYRRDLVNHTTQQVDVTPGGASAAADVSGTAMSYDGRLVAFTSTASNLVSASLAPRTPSTMPTTASSTSCRGTRHAES